MYNLIILCIFDPFAKMTPQETRLVHDFNESQAGLRALRWLTYRPNDIVMLVDA